jgi:RNA polymerase III transcription factor (TF)IIIC subunit HTH domain
MSSNSAVLPPTSGQDDAAERQRAQALATAVRTLIAELPAAEQERLLDELRKRLRPISVPQAGDVLETIVRLFPKRPEWTVENLREKVEQEGIAVNAKQVYNALGYLRRKGKIQRVGHGRYIVGGGLLETTEDLGVGPPTRHEIDET